MVHGSVVVVLVRRRRQEPADPILHRAPVRNPAQRCACTSYSDLGRGLGHGLDDWSQSYFWVLDFFACKTLSASNSTTAGLHHHPSTSESRETEQRQHRLGGTPEATDLPTQNASLSPDFIFINSRPDQASVASCPPALIPSHRRQRLSVCRPAKAFLQRIPILIPWVTSAIRRLHHHEIWNWNWNRYSLLDLLNLAWIVTSRPVPVVVVVVAVNYFAHTSLN
ncbi:uncharacterized protein BDZ83DRAFT_650781 [Colletotrichum acutatum]|uniref:Uncharacterized protein n=1 Tax=Glomerella acutata TaxID=27357 RepID=A0AAD8XH01_GLOAC|nr:uncharacterized protein BDZ83DRAFT_650781 [Colletotrichum acutatum]KAK1725956.1 hypothetical protein BDZ83DRAFT_650781 [Colletotrichum acutatum]